MIRNGKFSNNLLFCFQLIFVFIRLILVVRFILVLNHHALDRSLGLLSLNKMIIVVDTGMEKSRENILTRIVDADITVDPMLS